jgi:hypothetical protein
VIPLRISLIELERVANKKEATEPIVSSGYVEVITLKVSQSSS